MSAYLSAIAAGLAVLARIFGRISGEGLTTIPYLTIPNCMGQFNHTLFSPFCQASSLQNIGLFFDTRDKSVNM